MKKLISIIMVLAMMLSGVSLASCNKDELSAEELAAHNAYNEALKKTNELDSLDGKLVMNISMNVQGMTQTVSYDFDMKATGAKDPATMKMRMKGTMDLAGTKTVMDCYVENGWGYYDMEVSGQKLQFKTNLNGEGDGYSDMFNMGTVELPKKLFKNVSVTEKPDGSKLLDVTLSGKQILSLYTDLAASGGMEVKPSDISDASVIATVDKSGYLAKVEVKFTMLIQGISAKTVMTVEYFNLGSPVAVTPIDGYKSFPEQSLG